MKRTSCFLAVIIALFTAGCTEVPEDVKSRAEERQAVISQADVSGHSKKAELIPTDELQADAEQALKGKYRNFILAESIRLELPEEYIKCDFTQADGFQSNAEKIAERFFTEDELADETLMEQAEIIAGSPVKLRSFRNEEKQLHCSVWDNGFCCLMKPEFFQTLGSDGTFYKLYHADRGDDLSDSYQLEDGELTVKEAVELAQAWADKNFSDPEPEYKFRVKTVIVKKNDFGEYHFAVRIAKSYKGIYLDELHDLVDYSEQIPDSLKHYIRVIYSLNHIDMKIKKKSEIGYFTNTVGRLVPKENGRLEKVVSLSSALGCIEEKFADFSEPMTIGDIKLKYMLTPIYDYKYNESNILYYAAGTEFKSRIVWEFVIDVPQEQGSTMNDVRKYICVDAETGEIIFNFELNTLGQ